MDRCTGLRTVGVYSILLNIVKRICLDVGSLGRICIDEGLYSYIGSARGSGGIEARVKRHIARGKKRLWWHIDYITSSNDVEIPCVVYGETIEDLEYVVATALSRSRCWTIAVSRFGSSDKRSVSHLFRCSCSFSRCLDELVQVFASVGLEPCIYSFNSLHLEVKDGVEPSFTL